MKTLKELTKNGEKVYVYLKDEQTAKDFTAAADREGIDFGDGVKASKRHLSDLYALYPDGTLSYVTTNGRIAFSAGKGAKRIDYAEYTKE